MAIETDGQPEHATLKISGEEHEVVSVSGREAIGRPFRYEVVAHGRVVDLDPASLLGHAAVLALTDGFGGERTVTAIVAEAEVRAHDEHACVLTVVLRPDVFKLDVGRSSRVYHDMTVLDIARDVLARGGVPVRVDASGSYASRVYTAQYRESDWAFISRLFEEEGIYAWFDHDTGSRLVLSDSSVAAPPIRGESRILFRPEAGLQVGGEVIDELGAFVRATPTRVSLFSFDPARPSFQVSGGHGQGPLQVYDAPGGGSTDPSVLAQRARVMVEAGAAARRGVVGRTSSARLAPGRSFEVFGHHEAALDGKLFVTHVEVEIVQRRRDAATDGRRPFVSRFRAVPLDLPVHVEPSGARPLRPSLQSGTVVGADGSEVHPHETGAVRVQLHWDREGNKDDKSGKWMRVAQRGTADSMLLPRIGWNVFTTNEEGDADAPVVHSRMFDGAHLPPYPLPANLTRTVFKTATTPGGGSFNEVRYTDTAGAQEMFINASRDMSVLVQNRKTEDVKANLTRSVGNDHALDVGNNAQEGIMGNQTISIGGSESEKVGQSRAKTVDKNETIAIGGSRSLKVGGAVETSAGASRSLSVGVAQLDISLGDMTLSTPAYVVLVGGAVVRATPRDITEDVGMVLSTTSVVNKAVGMVGLGGIGGAVVSAAAGAIPSASVGAGLVVQTIGGAKFELAGTSRSITASKSYTETVGGAMILKSLGIFTDEAVTGYTLSAGLKLDFTAMKELVIEGDTITLEVQGGTQIVVDKKLGVKISSASMDLSGASLAAEPKGKVKQN